jgi:hypothetical protein
MSFYITLPSNVNNNVVENTQSNYTTTLQTPIEVVGEYEVALVEFAYREFIEVDLGKILVKFKNDNNFRQCKIIAYENEPKDHFITRLNFRMSHYFSLLEYYSKDINVYEDNELKIAELIKTKFNKADYEKVFASIKPICPKIEKSADGLHLKIPEGSIKFEGYAQNLFNAKTELNSDHTFVLFSELLNFYDYMYVYCDIIQYQRIGDQYGQLLRTITKTSDFNKTIEKIFIHPHYLPVSNSIINTINIRITDPSGNQVKFGNINSKVIAKLHFRPKNV